MYEYIYLACAIDLADDQIDPDRIALQLSKITPSLPVFRPARAWLVSPNIRPAGVNALVKVNTQLAMEARLMVAVVDLDVPSWGMPLELLSRTAAMLPTVVILKQGGRDLPMYLRWAVQKTCTQVLQLDSETLADELASAVQGAMAGVPL